MACATLKRSLDWDPLGSPTNSPPSKDSPSTGRPSKRHCSSHNLSNTSFLTPLKEPSPFPEVSSKINSDAINARLSEEVRRLSNKKQFAMQPQQSSMTTGRAGLTSPNMPFTFTGSPDKLVPPVPCTSPALGLMAPSRKDMPIFNFKQVSLICERLLRERENQLREEYDKILGQKLSEQYDTFVKFTYDQIQRGFDSTPSYLS